MSRPIPVAIGIGSNVGDRAQKLRLAALHLRRLLSHIGFSPVYETAPRYVMDQPPFLNACCVGETNLAPRELLADLLRIERVAGRRRSGRRYGPRRLDLDLLLYGEQVIEERDVVVPHPRLRERAFVLVPLREIAADWRVPQANDVSGRTVAELVESLPSEGVKLTDIELERS